MSFFFSIPLKALIDVMLHYLPSIFKEIHSDSICDNTKISILERAFSDKVLGKLLRKQPTFFWGKCFFPVENGKNGANLIRTEKISGFYPKHLVLFKEKEKDVIMKIISSTHLDIMMRYTYVSPEDAAKGMYVGKVMPLYTEPIPYEFDIESMSFLIAADTNQGADFSRTMMPGGAPSPFTRVVAPINSVVYKPESDTIQFNEFWTFSFAPNAPMEVMMQFASMFGFTDLQTMAMDMALISKILTTFKEEKLANLLFISNPFFSMYQAGGMNNYFSRV